MPATILDTQAIGPVQDWEVIGSVPAYEAVRRGSGDARYVRSNTTSGKTYYSAGAGYMPYYGSITAVTLYYRIRLSQPGFAVAFATMLRNGVEEHLEAIALTTTTWIDGHVRVSGDWITGIRFNPAGVGDLGPGAFVWIAPAAGYIEVSELWLEVEYLDSPTTYDPMLTPVLPDFVTGDMAWSTAGTQIAIIVAGDILRIIDTSLVDYRSYYRSDLVLPEQYITEIETRVGHSVVPPITHTGFFYYIAAYDDGHRSIYLALYNVGALFFVGLTGAGLDHDDPTKYLATYQIDPFDLEGIYFRLLVDRDTETSSIGRVKVYLDYTDTPVMTALYTDFPATAANRILFGTGDPLSAVLADLATLDIDFFSWHHYKKHGETFSYWQDVEQGTNQIEADSTDSSIWKPVFINPPGIMSGQSDYVCKLGVQDSSVECFVRQFWMMGNPTPVTYDLTIDYRMDALLATGFVSLQRRSDHWYWNEALSLWQAAASYVTLPNQLLRTKLVVMNAITTPQSVPYEEVFIFEIGKLSAAPAAYNLYIYKTFLV